MTAIFPFDLGTFIHSDTHRLSTRNVFQNWLIRVLQDISEQKLKPPSSPAPLSLYWKQRQTSICIKHVSSRSPKIVFPAFCFSRLHLSNPERLLRKYLQRWDYFDYIWYWVTRIYLGHNMGYLIINSQQDYSLSKSKLCNCIILGWRPSNKLATSSRSIGISYLICMKASKEGLIGEATLAHSTSHVIV